MQLTEEEVKALESEIARREEVISNLVQAAVDKNPGEVLKHFESELKRRLSEQVEDYKIYLLQSALAPELLEDEDEEEPSEELDETTTNLFQAVSELTEEEFRALLEDPDLDDEDKQLLIQVAEALEEAQNE